MAEYKGELYVGGKFRSIDGKECLNIAKWDGLKWTVIPGVWSDFTQIHCMAVYKGELYVGGHFWYAGGKPNEGGKPAAFIARWDGSTWRSVGQGLNSIATSMVVDTIRNVLYVGGYFAGIANDTIQGQVIMWDGTQWNEVGQHQTLFSKPGAVEALEMYNGYLYAGGLSDKGRLTDTVLARWDGRTWEAILGINGNVSHLKHYRDKLYLDGSFKMIRGDSIPYLASYYDTTTAQIVNSINIVKQSKSNFIVFPNPGKNTISIKSSLKFDKIEICDLKGSVLISVKYSEQIDVSKLSSGSYVINAYNGSNCYVTRFQKE